MSVATQLKIEQNDSLLQQMVDWMRDGFNGSNAGELANDAAKLAISEKLISGPLWEEIGPGYLYKTFTEQLRASRRNSLRPSARADGTDEWERSSLIEQGKARVEFINIPGTNEWLDILNVRKSDIKRITAHYQTIVDGNAFERDFWLHVDSNLKSSQRVGDVFDNESLKELRRKIAIERKGIKE